MGQRSSYLARFSLSSWAVLFFCCSRPSEFCCCYELDVLIPRSVQKQSACGATLDPRDDYCRSASFYCGTLVFTRPELCVTTRALTHRANANCGAQGCDETRDEYCPNLHARLVDLWGLLPKSSMLYTGTGVHNAANSDRGRVQMREPGFETKCRLVFAPGRDMLIRIFVGFERCLQ